MLLYKEKILPQKEKNLLLYLYINYLKKKFLGVERGIFYFPTGRIVLA